MRKHIKSIKINREYELMVPKLSDEDYQNLETSIKEDGLFYPLIINPEGFLLDGHHRLKACEAAGITHPEVIEKKFETSLDEREFVILSNLNRRHLNTAQKSELGLKLLEIEKEKAKERQLSGLKQYQNEEDPEESTVPPTLAEREDDLEEDRNAAFDKVIAPHIPDERGIEDEGESRKIVAQKVGVGKETLRKAEKIKEAAREDPEIGEEWERAKRGETSVNRVYNEHVKPSSVAEERCEQFAGEVNDALDTIVREDEELKSLPSHKEYRRREKLVDAARAILNVIDDVKCPVCGVDHTHLRWVCDHDMDIKDAARVIMERYDGMRYKEVREELYKRYGPEYDKIEGEVE